MKHYSISLDMTISHADRCCMEDFIAEYIDPSTIAQALENIEDNELEQTYCALITKEFLRQSILRENDRREQAEAA